MLADGTSRIYCPTMKGYVERLQLVEAGLESVRAELQALYGDPEARRCLKEIDSAIDAILLLERSWTELVEEETARGLSLKR
jgi:hypothetical protein